MAGTTLDIIHLLSPDNLGYSIARKWQEWHTYRSKWVAEKTELRNYVFATDTTTTTNKRLPWANSTTTPKLTQIYDNLKANYSSALFPNAHWMRWQGNEEDAETVQKVETIQAYMENKVRMSDFEITADKLIDDFILYGNCFATVEWVEDINELPEGETIASYIGPRLVRISPYDIVFDPTAAHWKDTPKIVRSIVKLGEVKKMIEAGGNDEYQAVFDKMLGNRREVALATSIEKSEGFVADGFNSIQHYYGSDHVELLTFQGDIYDMDEQVLMTNRKIVVADRAYVISNEKIASWLGHEPIFHAGWRSRPDNLYAMGPLDNLVGLQYRIDHLENLKADVFDQIAFPIQKIRGDVEEYDYQPGTKIRLGEEGDVTYLAPDTTALNADFQIQDLSNKMEELAGAPRQAMGIRTPGEKTAFEVSALQNASSRIFQHKAEKFEREFLQPVLNAMLESARRNMDVSDTIRVLDDASGVAVFDTITRADIQGNGRIVPVGASHFAERAQRVQNIQNMMAMKQDPSIAAHISGKKVAEIISTELGEKALFGVNIAVEEQLETQKAMQDAEAQNAEDLSVAAELGT